MIAYNILHYIVLDIATSVGADNVASSIPSLRDYTTTVTTAAALSYSHCRIDLLLSQFRINIASLIYSMFFFKAPAAGIQTLH